MADENKDIALLGRLLLFGLATDRLMTGQATDAQPVLDELKQLVTDNPNADGVFQVVAPAAQAFQGIGDEQATTEAFDAIVVAYQQRRPRNRLASPGTGVEHKTARPAGWRAWQPGSGHGQSEGIAGWRSLG